MSTQSNHCSTLLFSHLHSPAFFAFLSSLPLHLTCYAELRDQLGATERSHRRSERCEDLIKCVSHLRGAQLLFRLVVFQRLVSSAIEPIDKCLFLCNHRRMLAHVLRNILFMSSGTTWRQCEWETCQDRWLLCRMTHRVLQFTIIPPQMIIKCRVIEPEGLFCF